MFHFVAGCLTFFSLLFVFSRLLLAPYHYVIAQNCCDKNNMLLWWHFAYMSGGARGKMTFTCDWVKREANIKRKASLCVYARALHWTKAVGHSFISISLYRQTNNWHGDDGRWQRKWHLLSRNRYFFRPIHLHSFRLPRRFPAIILFVVSTTNTMENVFIFELSPNNWPVHRKGHNWMERCIIVALHVYDQNRFNQEQFS